MCYGAARQCTVAVPAFEYAHDPAMGAYIGHPARLASKSVVESDEYPPVVPRHRWILMLASIEPAASVAREVVSGSVHRSEAWPGRPRRIYL